MKTIVVTGGIGSGKSLVCRLIAENLPGTLLYNADERAKALYTSVDGFLDELERRFCTGLRGEDGSFLPSALASIIFENKNALDYVESRLFPLMKEDFRSMCDLRQPQYAVFESATILEKPFFSGFGDWVVLVDAPLEVRISRACRRDMASRERILRRTAAQPLANLFSNSIEDGTFSKLPQSSSIDTIISNNGSTSSLEEQVKSFISTLL